MGSISDKNVKMRKVKTVAVSKKAIITGHILLFAFIVSSHKAAAYSKENINEIYMYNTVSDLKSEGYNNAKYDNITITASESSSVNDMSSAIWESGKTDDAGYHYLSFEGSKEPNILYVHAKYKNKSNSDIYCVSQYPFAWGNHHPPQTDNPPKVSSIFAWRDTDKGVYFDMKCSDSTDRTMYYNGAGHSNYFQLLDKTKSTALICRPNNGPLFYAKDRSWQVEEKGGVCGEYYPFNPSPTPGDNGIYFYDIGLGKMQLSGCGESFEIEKAQVKLPECQGEKNTFTLSFQNTYQTCSIEIGKPNTQKPITSITCSNGVKWLHYFPKTDYKYPNIYVFGCSSDTPGSHCLWLETESQKRSLNYLEQSL